MLTQRVKSLFGNILSRYLVINSLIGLFILTLLTFHVQPPAITFSWRKLVAVSTFGLICLLGILAGLYPSKCSLALHFRIKDKHTLISGDRNSQASNRIDWAFEGHHPKCGKFSSHVVRFGGKPYCAGCTGLIIGALLSLLGILLYFLVGLPHELRLLFFWLGFVTATFGLLQYEFSIQRGLVHLLLNVAFVVGTFLLFIGVEELTSNLVVDAYSIILTLYWISNRIQLSEKEHTKICRTCGVEGCRFHH